MLHINEYCKMVVELLTNKGKEPGYFAKRNLYRKGTEFEWNTAHLWLECRKDCKYKVDIPIGICDNKTILEFKIIDPAHKGWFEILTDEIDDLSARRIEGEWVKLIVKKKGIRIYK